MFVPLTRWTLATAAAAALVVASAWALVDAHRLQSRLDRAAALDRARHAVAESLSVIDSSRARAPLLRLLAEARGFKFLAVRDSHGAVHAVADVYETLSRAGLSASTVQQLREALYTLTSTHGRLRVQTASGEGELEFALSDTVRAEVHDEAVSRLSRYAGLGLLLGFAALTGLMLSRRETRPVANVRERLQQPPQETTARAPQEPKLLPLVVAEDSAALRSEELLNRVTEAVLGTDEAGVIRYANARALTMFGYAREAVVGGSLSKLLPVPFLNDTTVRLADFIFGGSRAHNRRVVGWKADAQSFEVEIRVERLTRPGELALFLQVVE